MFINRHVLSKKIQVENRSWKCKLLLNEKEVTDLDVFNIAPFVHILTLKVYKTHFTPVCAQGRVHLDPFIFKYFPSEFRYETYTISVYT